MISTSPSPVSRAILAENRARTSAGSASLRATAQRSSAFEFTLLTFCPPGPPLRKAELEFIMRNANSCVDGQIRHDASSLRCRRGQNFSIVILWAGRQAGTFLEGNDGATANESRHTRIGPEADYRCAGRRC